tara:strand:- start:375 stop:824 length:450 start_codon:yes stop_codon:yes gene_type:complete
MNDKKVVEFTEQRYARHSKNDIINFIKSKQNSKTEKVFGIFIKLKNKNVHIGNIKLGPIDFRHKNALISYFIGEKKYWGKNITTIAIKKILVIAKKKYKLKKIYAGFYSNNIGSKKVLKKNGFKKEAHFKNQLVYKNKRIDHIYYGKEI